MKYTTAKSNMLADTYTPVSVYLKLRDIYPEAILLESTDYRAADNSFSYLCFAPLASINWMGNTISVSPYKGSKSANKIKVAEDVFTHFENFRLGFKEDENRS